MCHVIRDFKNLGFVMHDFKQDVMQDALCLLVEAAIRAGNGHQQLIATHAGPQVSARCSYQVMNQAPVGHHAIGKR